MEEINYYEQFMNDAELKPISKRPDIEKFRSAPPPEEELMLWGDRPVDLTQEKLNVLFKCMRTGGLSPEKAAAKARLRHADVLKWLERGLKETKGWYARFREEYLYADAMHEARYSSIIDRAARADPRYWRAAEKILSVRHSEWRTQQPVINATQTNNFLAMQNTPEVKALDEMSFDDLDDVFDGEIINE